MSDEMPKSTLLKALEKKRARATTETKAEKTEAALPLFWAWITEYPDEGAEIVAAPDEEAAHKRAMGFFNYEDPDDVTTKPVAEDDIDKIRDAAEKDGIDKHRLLLAVRELLQVAFDGPALPVDAKDHAGWRKGIEGRARFALEKAEEHR